MKYNARLSPLDFSLQFKMQTKLARVHYTNYYNN